MSESNHGKFCGLGGSAVWSNQADSCSPNSRDLRWETSKDGVWYAKSGAVTIATVVRRNDDSACYSMDAINTRWIAKGHGEVKTVSSAKRAVERAWTTWLARAGL